MRRIRVLLFIGLMLLLAGCTFYSAAPQNQATVEPPKETIAAISTLAPQIIVVTPTPETISATSVATQPAGNSSDAINLTSVQDMGGGKAVVHWAATGAFPAGFKIVWSAANVHPTYPEDNSSYAGDPNSQSAMISGQLGKIYYVRVCRYVNDQCDLYSNLGIFAFIKPVSTSVPPTSTAFILGTRTPGGSTGGGGGGGATATPNGIKITGITDGGPGKAYIVWEASGTFANGFKIVYSKTSTTPTFGKDSYFVIKDGTARSAYVDGASGTKYYYRVCRYTGTTCDMYSNVVSYTFPGPLMTNTPGPSPTPDLATINISAITNTTLGNATITWTATGQFPTGFKILYSKTHSLPTLADSYVYVSNGALRTANFTGDPGASYYVRICKYFASTCVVYSSVQTFVFTAAPSITITSITDTTPGTAKIDWTASGVFDYGFAVMYSAAHNPPTLSDTVVNVPDGTTRTGTVTGTAGTKYYFRICSLNSTGSCVVNSPVVNFTFARITLTGVSQNALTVGHITWTDSGAFPLGFGLMRSTLNIIPSYGADHFESVPGGASPLFYNFTIPQPGLTYYLDLCQVTSSGCGIYSNILIFDTSSDITLSAIDGSTTGTAALTWTLPATLPTNGYLIYRADGTGDPALSGSSVGSVTDNSLHTFDDTTIASSGTAYSYRICAYNGSTCTEFSNKVSFTVP